MAYGIQIGSAIGSDDITDLTSFRVIAVQSKTESVTTAAQTFTYTAPFGWTTSNGTFYVVPNSSGVLPSFYQSGTNQLKADFAVFNSIYKATSWSVFWLVKTGIDGPSGYGVLVSNGSGQTVISNDTETMLAASSGTLSSYTTTNTGWRQFTMPAGFSIDSDAIFLKLPDGGNLIASSRNTYNASESIRINTTTETGLDYFVVKRSFSISSPTGGYGLVVFDGSGSVVYSTEYDVFPSNGSTLRVQSGATTTIDPSKDVWVNLNFGTPAPFCPDGGAGGFPTFNLASGVQRSGSSVSYLAASILNTAPGADQVSSAHDNTALIVQR